MLSIKNLTKIYRIRGANQVLALNNVSIDFPERGLIFVLGKSGCGKSTLLNLIGGLEKPTSGEIVINGKSTKHFKNKDFDFYRNTYIGFVFQEYNLINNLSIEDNISISLQLQGKKPNRNDVEETLKLVGLEELENRLPEELSGGQKQRIAIARALIKKPKIILADEPSGSLDSVSGKQVFDLLKELSKDRLVIVVSHDEDFANKYADRIINLKDGKIVKDIIKNKIETIKDNEKLYELKKSNLPIKLAFKMGLHTLKLKPIRLSITVLLSVIAFTIFGLFSTLIFYDPAYSYSEAIKKENYNSIRLEKNYKYNYKYYRFDKKNKETTLYKNSQENATCGISMNDLNNLNNNSLGLNFAGIYNNNQKGFPYTSFINNRTNNEFYFYSNFAGLTDCGEDFLLNQNFKKIAGHYPQNYNEIAISTYALELFEDGGFKSLGGAVKAINNAEDILNCELELPLPHCYYADQSVKLTICGVYDVGKEYNDKKFDLLKKYNIETSNDPSFKEVSDKFKDAFTSCFYSLGFISEDFFDTYSSYLTPVYYALPRIEHTQLYGVNIITSSEINSYKSNPNDD
ncbi:MAG: ABC transporter ATP-binding protein, partial [Bacilli bacterium]|nr:ABC transporter ATP-binding protein [Bacilli bacterium]